MRLVPSGVLALCAIGLMACADGSTVTAPRTAAAAGVSATAGPPFTPIASNANGEYVGIVGSGSSTQVAYWSAARGLITVNPFASFGPGVTIETAFDLVLLINNKGVVFGSGFLADPSFQFSGLERPFVWRPGSPAQVITGFNWEEMKMCCANDRGVYVINNESAFPATSVRVGSLADGRNAIDVEFDLRDLVPDVDIASAGIRALSIDQNNVVTGITLDWFSTEKQAFVQRQWTWAPGRGLRWLKKTP